MDSDTLVVIAMVITGFMGYGLAIGQNWYQLNRAYGRERATKAALTMAETTLRNSEEYISMLLETAATDARFYEVNRLHLHDQLMVLRAMANHVVKYPESPSYVTVMSTFLETLDAEYGWEAPQDYLWTDPTTRNMRAAAPANETPTIPEIQLQRKAANS